MVLFSCTAVLAISLLIPATHGISPFGFQESTPFGFTLGDDVTLTCPVTLCAGEEYKKVEWTFWSCGRYHFKNYCFNRFIWEEGTITRTMDGMTSYVPSNGSEHTTLTVKNATCAQSAYYHCHVVGTGGTDKEHGLDVHLFSNSSAKAKLTPDPIVVEDDVGPMEFTCVDEAFVPGSFIRMYYVYYSWRATYTEAPTTCTVEYLPGKCSEVATCRASFDKRNLRNHGAVPNSVHCEITRADGKRVETRKRVMIKKCSIV